MRFAGVAAWSFIPFFLLWFILVLGMVQPESRFAFEAVVGLFLLFLVRLFLVPSLRCFAPVSRRLLVLFALADIAAALGWLLGSDAYAEIDFWGFFSFYPFMVPGAMLLFAGMAGLLIFYSLLPVRELFVRRSQPLRAVRWGILRTFAEPRLSSSLSVLDNVRLGRYCHCRTGLFESIVGMPKAIREEQDSREKAIACLRFVGLDHYLIAGSGAGGCGAWISRFGPEKLVP